MTKRNIKKIIVTVTNSAKLSLINSTPALRRMFHTDLVLGDNEMSVNHAQFAEIKRWSATIGYIFNEKSN